MSAELDERRRQFIRDGLAERVAEAKRDPAAARARLIREGFYTEDGELTPEYGGPPRKDPTE